MKRQSIYCAAAIAAALALGAMAGCSGLPASQASTSPESASAASSAAASAQEAASESASAEEAVEEAAPESSSAEEAAPESASESEAAPATDAAEKSQEEIIAELKESLANVPAYKSVTITEKRDSWSNDGAEAEATEVADLPTESTSVYKFDESGDKVKTSSTTELGGVKMQYFTEGDDAVCVTDGPAYSGTAEQFGLNYTTGADAYLKDVIGDLNVFVDCISSVTQDEIDGVMGYELTLDPEKYIESNETLKLMAEYDDPVNEAYATVGFDKDGRIVWMTKTDCFATVTSVTLLDLEDFDSTVVDPMPEATNTYEEMEADIQMKHDALDDMLDLDEELEEEAGSSEAAEAK